MNGKKILIIDDDEAIAGIFQNRFQAEGFRVQLADDGESALALLKNEPPDLVVLDLGLPGMNGVEVLKSIRARAETQALPVIVLSNSYLVNLVKAAWKAGATKCLTKTDCTPRHLLEIVRATLADSMSRPGPGAAAGATTSAASTAIPVSAQNSAGAREQQPLAESDTDSQTRLIGSFLVRARQTVATLRQRLQAFAKAWNPNLRTDELFQLYRLAHSLTGTAGLIGFRKITHMANALEALLKELDNKPTNVTLSVIRTIASAVDSLARLLDEASHPRAETAMAPMIMVVDDEIISRETICSALQKAGLRAVSLDDPSLALRVLEQNRFDLVFLDVDMPGQDGFGLCEKIRKMPTNRATPVVFVTSHGDFANRARSTLSGGNDFITKPFLLLELAVKALSRILDDGRSPVGRS